MLFHDTFKIPISKSKSIYSVKGSKFISYVFPVNNEENVRKILEELKNTEKNADHFCYAYIINPDKSSWRAYDDGEPNGTAGKPILNQIKSYDLTNILIVVVRYFGGTKLGIKGLINAYKESSRNALQKNNFKTCYIEEFYEVLFKYSQVNKVMKVIKENSLKIISHKFDIDSFLIFSVRKKCADKIISILKNKHNLNVKYKMNNNEIN